MFDPTDLGFWIPTIIAVAALYFAWEERRVIKSLLEIMNLQRQDMKSIRNSQMSSQDLENQRILRDKERLAWDKTVGLAKGIGWFLDQVSDSNDE